MYTFDTSVGGRDEAGGVNNTMTNYYIRKYVYLGWNKDDDKVQTMPKSIFFMRWTHMCLIFAEAANRVSGPTTELYGYTPKQAIAYLRSRPTNDGIAGVGATADPYLDECAAAGPEEFEKLVRNERRIELCFEGQRFYDLRPLGDGRFRTQRRNQPPPDHPPVDRLRRGRKARYPSLYVRSPTRK